MLGSQWKKRQAAVLNARKQRSLVEIASEFGVDISQSKDMLVLEAVLEELRAYSSVGPLTLVAGDDLAWLLGVLPDEVEEVCERIVTRLGHRLPGTPYRLPKIVTVKDLFIAIREYLDHTVEQAAVSRRN